MSLKNIIKVENFTSMCQFSRGHVENQQSVIINLKKICETFFLEFKPTKKFFKKKSSRDTMTKTIVCEKFVRSEEILNSY